jgi:hypothetical protein
MCVVCGMCGVWYVCVCVCVCVCACVCVSALSTVLELFWNLHSGINDTPVIIHTCSQMLVSKYHSALEETRIFWRNH